MIKERITNVTHIPWGVFMSNNANVALKTSSCSCSLSGSSTFCLPPLRVWTSTYCHTFPKAALLFAKRCARVSSFSISHQSTLKSLWTSGVSCFINPCVLSGHTLCSGRDVTWLLDWLMSFACPIFFMKSDISRRLSRIQTHVSSRKSATCYPRSCQKCEYNWILWH